jgi:hypothetical protein
MTCAIRRNRTSSAPVTRSLVAYHHRAAWELLVYLFSRRV